MASDQVRLVKLIETLEEQLLKEQIKSKRAWKDAYEQRVTLDALQAEIKEAKQRNDKLLKIITKLAILAAGEDRMRHWNIQELILKTAARLPAEYKAEVQKSLAGQVKNVAETKSDKEAT